MYSAATDSRITGFEFHPEFEKIRGEDVLKCLNVDFLEKGRLISTEFFDGINEEQLERLQQQLLDLTIINLNLEENWTKAKELSMRTKVLGVVNMFRIDTLKENEDGTMDINVGFIRSGYRAADSIFKNVSVPELEEIEWMLSNNTAFNLRCDRQCNAVTYIDLIAVIDQKLSK